MSSDASKAPLLILIGIASVAGAVALAWFSSVATMRLERTGGQTATIAIESRLFGLINVRHERIDGVRSATMVDSRTPGSRSSTPPHMVLETVTGPINAGRLQQLFVRDFDEIKSFLEDQTQRQATLSSISRSSELVRFAIAQLVVVFLAFGGLGVAWLGIKSF